MILDENEFFRQITLRICEHLDIEESMSSCLRYLGGFMPADVMYLELFEPDLGAVRGIARATAEKGTKLDDLVPLPSEARAFIIGFMADTDLSDPVEAMIVNRPELQAVSQVMLKFLDLPDWSHLVLPLVMKDKPLGSLILLAEGRDRYSAEHARLFGLLREPFRIAMSNALEHREVLKLKDILTDDNRFLHREMLRISGDHIVGEDFGLKHVMDLVRQVAPLDSPVLLLGETGVGKDVMSNAIHDLSPRKNGPFIRVNCGAIPETLIDSELFGHEKGAFTGALTQKRGRFERADKGTIFLDEIGELPPQAQVRMLRVLQNKDIERVGGSQSIPVDIRVIAATHRNLPDMVKSNQFREDLWFRLNVFPVSIPPLRERAEDIPALVHFFIDRKSKGLKILAPSELAPGAMDRLTAYPWPGNVRELENVIERAMILHQGGPLNFGIPDQSPPRTEPAALPDEGHGPDLLDEIVSRHIRRVLAMTNGKVHGPGGAAERLGINPSTLRNRMNKLGIPYGRRRRRDI